MKRIGRGRSGTVYRLTNAAGQAVARKIFTGEPLSKLVHYVLSGAPNPYAWCEPAIRCAVYRRQILVDLVAFWFADHRLRVAAALDHGWNEERQAFQVDLEFVAGRHAALRNPFLPGAREYADLARQVMAPLDKHLEASGFDGLVWQAGRGNPVAGGNFMLDAAADGDAPARWVWIDLESGVPALFPLNPLPLLTFYLPKSWHHRRPLFDDVDCDKLRQYVTERRDALTTAIGADRLTSLEEGLHRLESEQRRWRSLSRIARGIAYQQRKRMLTAAEADWYRTRPLHWYARELRRGGRAGLDRGRDWLAAAARRLRQFDYRRALRATVRFFVSQSYRAEISRRYVALRIDAWEERRQLSAADSQAMRRHLEAEGSSAFISDFGVHLAVKPAVKIVQWLGIPILVALGALSVGVGAILLLCGGMLVRTAYTLGRIVHAAATGDGPLPWVALVAGTLPMIGNAAYPCEILYRGEKENKLAAFIVYDTFTAVGENLPVWGGENTGTEHWFNAFADIVARRGRRRAEEASAPA